MDGGVDDMPSFWMEESEELLYVPMKMKRKSRTKKMEFVGWGSKPLIEFLESIGRDSSKPRSQYEVTSIINEYVNTNNLIHPQKKKRVQCDERLHYLFGKKSLVRIKIYDLLEAHFADNQDESDGEFFYSSEENDENMMTVREQQKASVTDRKNLHPRKKVIETPKSCFAATILANIKLVYLKRSLVQDLLKDPETFEGKLVGSFVRVKCDPNDLFQKNSHQLLQVTGVRKASGADNSCTNILLQVSDMMKEICISMLSDDNFSEEECEDLRQRVKSGSLKRPTVVEFQQKAQILHEDITKHWLVRELNLLQNLIDRANEKGWRKELDEYLKKKQLLQTPSEQSRLLLEIPNVIADEVEEEARLQEGTNASPKSIFWEAIEISSHDLETNQILSTQNSDSADAAGSTDVATASAVTLCDSPQAREENRYFSSGGVSNRKQEDDLPAQFFEQQTIHHRKLEESKKAGRMVDKQIVATQVIEVLDDDSEEGEDHPGCGDLSLNDEHPGRMIWHYKDPRGIVQGPFSVESLKCWRDANYFPPEFKVWKIGQRQDEAVLLTDVLLRMFSNSVE
ncbi:uncharacterized protein At5g08430 isoform X2 [Rhododendron vialii]|uniref:uncharacterized protein At5g08430 isoform X2 n=1 Tax=Rhododendron vialii TaxID=182163 RepID=UPI00265E4011|nr:uncharacterized protein At5g08430 isoform X2 [Rhododendron vialii]